MVCSLPLLSILTLVEVACATSYWKSQSLASNALLDHYSFYTGTDPTNGFTHYVDKSTAEELGLVKVFTNGSVYVGVDHTDIAPSGRKSVRLVSNAYYHQGLLAVLDLSHMPGGICAVWPAFWSKGKQWPDDGEIDIIEGVNQQDSNQMTLHTSSECSISNSGFSGYLLTSNCDTEASGQASNAGCGIRATRSDTFGAGFNALGGGAYVMEWTASEINVWFFPRDKAAKITKSDTLRPLDWGAPVAKFSGNCNISSHFGPQEFIFDITFCGDWAGAAWTDSSCATLGDCSTYVAQNPNAFRDQFWMIESFDIYSSAQPASQTQNSMSGYRHTSTSTSIQATPSQNGCPASRTRRGSL